MTLDCASWNAAPEQLLLSDDEIHVWRARLEQPPSKIGDLLKTLAADERERAEKFRFQRDREHFIIARGALRAILGRYLGQRPEQLRFSYSPYGKPALAGPVQTAGLHFNVSHAGGLALYAFTRAKEIGLDIERLRDDFDCGQIAQHYFSRSEVSAFGALPAEMRNLAFFNCWTRKEAYIKAIGEGLSHPLDQFDVSLAPGEPAALLSAGNDPQEAARWSLRELAPGHGYVAALAVKGKDWRLSCWQWTG
jgi:4'-phosphopantetheinyl transferase